jgi:hypothetical protein
LLELGTYIQQHNILALQNRANKLRTSIGHVKPHHKSFKFHAFDWYLVMLDGFLYIHIILSSLDSTLKEPTLNLNIWRHLYKTYLGLIYFLDLGWS